MVEKTLEKRVAALEAALSGFVTVADLERVQAALSQQILQLESAMRAEFSAVRSEMRAGDAETRQGLREEIRAGDEETRSLMRALHEDVIERLKLLGNNGPSKPRKG